MDKQHDIALDHVSRAPQEISCNYYMYIHGDGEVAELCTQIKTINLLDTL